MKSDINDKQQILGICAVCLSYELGEISAATAMAKIIEILANEGVKL